MGIAALAAGIGVVQAQQSADRIKSADSAFVTKAAEGGMAEVQMGQLATQRASNSKVKEFGQRMVDDHTKANDQLKQIASRKGLSLPSDMNAKQRSTYNRLSRLSGNEFDRAYMQDMVTDHQEDVAEFQREADNGGDPDVKSFAGSTLPTLQQHLRLAQDTRAQLGK
jgi:putative membrane protein